MDRPSRTTPNHQPRRATKAVLAAVSAIALLATSADRAGAAPLKDVKTTGACPAIGGVDTFWHGKIQNDRAVALNTRITIKQGGAVVIDKGVKVIPAMSIEAVDYNIDEVEDRVVEFRDVDQPDDFNNIGVACKPNTTTTSTPNSSTSSTTPNSSTTSSSTSTSSTSTSSTSTSSTSTSTSTSTTRPATTTTSSPSSTTSSTNPTATSTSTSTSTSTTRLPATTSTQPAQPQTSISIVPSNPNAAPITSSPGIVYGPEVVFAQPPSQEQQQAPIPLTGVLPRTE